MQTYSEQGAVWSSLQQGRGDVVMSTVNGLRYTVAHREGVKFQAAVNKLVEGGSHAKILKKWGTTDSALTKSGISPPEIGTS